jgi:hypothetical protein
LKRKLTQRKFATAIRKVLENQHVFPLLSSTSNIQKLSKFDLQSIEDHKSNTIFQNLFEIKYRKSNAPGNHSNAQKEYAYVGMREQIKNIDTHQQKALKAKDLAVLRALADALVEDYALEMFHLDQHFTDPTRRNLQFASEEIDEISILKTELHKRVEILLDDFYPELKIENVAVNSDVVTPVQADEVSVLSLGQGVAPHEYFGSSVTVADFTGLNGAKCDVLVGSYGAGRAGGPQEGAARILFGAACADASVTEFSSFRFRGGMLHGDPLPSYERFGWSSAASDVNFDGYTDAILCAPSFGGRNVSAAVGNYSGRCDIFYGPFHASADSNNAFSTPSVSIYGDKTWGLFGHAVAVGDVDADGLNDLVISAPGAGR